MPVDLPSNLKASQIGECVEVGKVVSRGSIKQGHGKYTFISKLDINSKNHCFCWKADQVYLQASNLQYDLYYLYIEQKLMSLSSIKVHQNKNVTNVQLSLVDLVSRVFRPGDSISACGLNADQCAEIRISARLDKTFILIQKNCNDSSFIA